jgi:hypothetical protein
MLRDWIKSARMILVAPEEAKDRQPKAPANPMSLDGLEGIRGTTRSEPAHGLEGWRNPPLIPSNQKTDDVLHRSHAPQSMPCGV